MSDIQTQSKVVTERPLKQAVLRGLAGRCPACGEGRLFSSYLKVVPHCPHCGEDLSPQRADDGPAYVTMLIVCHVAGFMVHGLFSWTALPPLWIAGIVSAAVLPLSLAMLPAAKGFFVAMQWAKYMHGFGRSRATKA